MKKLLILISFLLIPSLCVGYYGENMRFKTGNFSQGPMSEAGGSAVVSLSFDGTGDYVQYLNKPVTNYPFTFAVRIKDVSAIGQLIELSDGDQTTVYYTTLNRDDAPITRLTARNTTSQNTDETSTDSGDGEWHSVVAVFEDATTRTLYVDDNAGIATNTTSVTFNGNVSHFTVGSAFRASAASNTITGKLRDVRVWSRALTAQEATDFYNESFVPSTNLELWWKFDEGSGTTVSDASGNERNGSISGNPTWVEE